MKPEGVLDAICPDTWMRIKALRVFENSTDRAQRDDVQLSASQRLGVVPQSFLMAEEDQKYMLALSGTDNFKHVEVGDFVISLRSFEGGFEYSAHRGCVSPAYTVLRPKLEIDGSFWRHLFKSEVFKQMLAAFNVGIRDGKSIRYDDFSEFTLALPSLTEQLNLSSYLDRETARIDGLVSKKIRFIELLREKRQALITHAVTKGLDPNMRMKDSGVEWLGEVPEHWDVPSFQRCVSVAQGQVNPEVSPFREMVLLGPNHIESGSGRILFTETAYDQHAESGKYICEEGDIVYSKIRPALRKVCIAPLRCLCSADMYPLHAHSGMTNAFLFWFLLSEPFSAFAVLEADRVAMPKINRESLSKVLLPRPSIEDQSAIAVHLNHETTRIDTLITKTERSIELLTERRSALITAVVTGQIGVRGNTAGQDQLAA